jgi:hypothetical protein
MAAESNENVVVDGGELAHNSGDDIGLSGTLADLDKQLKTRAGTEAMYCLHVALEDRAALALGVPCDYLCHCQSILV